MDGSRYGSPRCRHILLCIGLGKEARPSFTLSDPPVFRHFLFDLDDLTGAQGELVGSIARKVV